MFSENILNWSKIRIFFKVGRIPVCTKDNRSNVHRFHRDAKKFKNVVNYSFREKSLIAAKFRHIMYP